MGYVAYYASDMQLRKHYVNNMAVFLFQAIIMPL